MVALHFAFPLYKWNLGMSRWWGLPFALCGLALVCACFSRFAPVTTLRPDESPAVLVTDGFYRVSRNPMYLGMLISLASAFVMLGSTTPVVALPLFYALIRVRYIAHEERLLEARFGDAYRDYRRRVRRWI